MEHSDAALKQFEEIKKDDDLLNDRREYDIEDLKKMYPDLKWSDAIDLRNLIMREFESAKSWTPETAPAQAELLQRVWDNVLDGSEDSPEILTSLAKKLKKMPGMEFVAPIIQRAAALENSPAASMSTRSKAFKEYERSWKDVRTNLEVEMKATADRLGLRTLGSGKLDPDEEATRFHHLSAEQTATKLQAVHDAIFENPNKPNFKAAKKALEGIPNADDVEIDLDAFKTDMDSKMHEEIPNLYDTWRSQLREELADLADYHEIPFKFRKPKKRKK